MLPEVQGVLLGATNPSQVEQEVLPEVQGVLLEAPSPSQVGQVVLPVEHQACFLPHHHQSSR